MFLYQPRHEWNSDVAIVLVKYIGRWSFVVTALAINGSSTAASYGRMLSAKVTESVSGSAEINDGISI
jgi:hypothetical protein